MGRRYGSMSKRKRELRREYFRKKEKNVGKNNLISLVVFAICCVLTYYMAMFLTIFSGLLFS